MSNFLMQTKRHCFFVVWILLMVLVTSCGGEERSQGVVTEVTPLPTGTPQVEYGASLDEWEEATRDEAEQEASRLASEPTKAAASTVGTPFTYEDVVYQEVMWEGLIPPDFSAEAIMARYDTQLAQFEDGAPEAMEIFSQMQEEFNNAPVNELLDETLIRLPGFVAPLDFQEEIVTEFLLVPYFGACIHVPPPPVNQTVLVKAAEGQGVKAEESYKPVWVMGKLATEAKTTELAAAGYYIQDAMIEPYDSP